MCLSLSCVQVQPEVKLSMYPRDVDTHGHGMGKVGSNHSIFICSNLPVQWGKERVKLSLEKRRRVGEKALLFFFFVSH